LAQIGKDMQQRTNTEESSLPLLPRRLSRPRGDEWFSECPLQHRGNLHVWIEDQADSVEHGSTAAF
jgi:hypothetical protein